MPTQNARFRLVSWTIVSVEELHILEVDEFGFRLLFEVD